MKDYSRNIRYPELAIRDKLYVMVKYGHFELDKGTIVKLYYDDMTRCPKYIDIKTGYTYYIYMYRLRPYNNNNKHKMGGKLI